MQSSPPSSLLLSSVPTTTLPNLPNVALTALISPRTKIKLEHDHIFLQEKNFHDIFQETTIMNDVISSSSSSPLESVHHRPMDATSVNLLPSPLTHKRNTFVTFPPRGGGQDGSSPGGGFHFGSIHNSNNNNNQHGGISQTLQETIGNNIRYSFGNGNDGSGGGYDNDDDSFSEVFYENNGNQSPSTGSRIASSLFGMVFGPFIIVASCMVLWKNEKWAIKTHRSLNEAWKAVQKIPPGIESYHEYDGQLIHYAGQISVDENGNENENGVSSSVRSSVSSGGGAEDYDFRLKRNAISIRRSVEIYQWVETKHETRRKLHDGRTERRVTYRYNKRWTDRPIQSEHFHKGGYDNWGYLPFESNTFYAENVFLGPFTLPQSIFGSRLNVGSTLIHPREIEYIPHGGMIEGTSIYFPSTTIHHNGDDSIQVPPAYKIETTIVSMDDDEDRILYRIADTGELFNSKKEAKAKVAMLEKSSSTTRKVSSLSQQQQQQQQQKRVIGSEPQIGDVRVQFTEVKCKPATVVGKLSGDTITQWKNTQGEGYEIALFRYGHHSANHLVESAKSNNSLRSWGLRAAGYCLSFMGFSMTTSIISTTAGLTLNWIPLFGPMARTIIDVGLTFANFILATSLSLLVASVSWLFYRPLIATPLLAGSFSIFYMASQMGVGNVSQNVHHHSNLKRDI